MLEMDAMIGTLEFVARSDWVTVLPSLISVNDIGKGELVVNPIVDPPLHAEFVVIQPARRTLSVAGAAVPRALRGRDRQHPGDLGRSTGGIGRGKRPQAAADAKRLGRNAVGCASFRSSCGNGPTTGHDRLRRE